MFSHVPRRRALLAAAIVVASVPVAASAPASAADAVCPTDPSNRIIVKIVSTAGGKDAVDQCYGVTAQQITDWADVEDEQYKTRAKPKTRPSDGVVVVKGVSLHKLLTSVDASQPDLDQEVTFSETPNASNIPAVLPDTDIIGPTDTTLAPAVYAPDDTTVGYVRPLKGAADVNVSDVFTVPNPLVLTFHTTGELVAPVVKASAGTSIKTKTKNTFSVTFDDPQPDDPIASTTWDFGDGRSSQQAKPTRSYRKQGTYPVVATVRGANGSYGRSAPLEIKVDKPPKKPKPSTGGTGTGSGTGGSGTGGGGFGGDSGGYIPPYDPGFGTLPSDDFSGDVPDGDLPPPEQETAPVDDGLEPVEGYVLAGAEIVPGGAPEQIPGTQESGRPTPAAQESTRQKIATWAIAALAAALLLAAGATSETRWFRNRLRHLRRRA